MSFVPAAAPHFDPEPLEGQLERAAPRVFGALGKQTSRRRSRPSAATVTPGPNVPTESRRGRQPRKKEHLLLLLLLLHAA